MIHQRNNSVVVAMGDFASMAGEPLTRSRPAGLAIVLGRLRGVALERRAAVGLELRPAEPHIPWLGRRSGGPGALMGALYIVLQPTHPTKSVAIGGWGLR